MRSNGGSHCQHQIEVSGRSIFHFPYFNLIIVSYFVYQRFKYGCKGLRNECSYSLHPGGKYKTTAVPRLESVRSCFTFIKSEKNRVGTSKYFSPTSLKHIYLMCFKSKLKISKSLLINKNKKICFSNVFLHNDYSIRNYKNVNNNSCFLYILQSSLRG